jgi:sugar phosphate permease
VSKSDDIAGPAATVMRGDVHILPARGMSRDAIRASALVVLCQVVHGFTFTAIPLLLPLIREDLGISFTQAGMLSAAATLSYALGQVPAGYLADRIGARRLIYIGLFGWSALSLALGLVEVFWLALLTQFIAGAFRSLLFAPGLALLVSWFPPERRATAISLYMLGGFAGNVVFSLVGPLLASSYGWRTAIIALAIPGVLAALLFKVYAKDKPRSHDAPRVSPRDMLGLVRHPIMWLCAGLQFVRFTVVTGFHVWLPSLLVTERGMSVQTAGMVVAAAAAFTGVSNLLGGYVCDRLKNPPLVIGVSLAILAGTSFALVSVESAPLLLLVIAINAIFLQFYFGALFLVPVEALGQRVAGSVTGVGNFFANVGAFLTAYLLGVAKDRTGSFFVGFASIAAVCLAGVLLSMLLARIRKPARPRESAVGVEPHPEP